MIIGLCGAARSGKDTVAEMLVQHLGVGAVKRIQIAGPLKRFCREVFDWTEDHTDGHLKDLPDERYPRPCKFCKGLGQIDHGVIFDAKWHPCKICDEGKKLVNFLTPREAMQRLGHEWSQPLYPTIWADKAARDAQKWVELGARNMAETVEDGLEDRVAIITDCRFLQDIQAIVNVGGTIIQVHREGAGLSGAAANHPGEIARKSPEFQALVTHHIHNDGTLDDLDQKVQNVLKWK